MRDREQGSSNTATIYPARTRQSFRLWGETVCRPAEQHWHISGQDATGKFNLRTPPRAKIPHRSDLPNSPDGFLYPNIRIED